MPSILNFKRLTLLLLFFLAHLYAQSDSTTHEFSQDSEPAEAAADTSENDGAGEDQKPIRELDKMIVTATKTNRRMSETPASVSVVDRWDIDNSPAMSVEEHLHEKAGTTVMRVTGIGEGIPSFVGLRGIPGAFAASRTLILVDGIPTNVAGTPFMLLNLIPAQAIEQIELVKGPQSSLYGANAFAGVINIVTREGTKEPQFDVNLETGILDYWNPAVWSGGGNDNVWYSFSAGYRNIDNYYGSDSVFIRLSDGTTTKKVARNRDYWDFRSFAKVSALLSEKLKLTSHARIFLSELGFGETLHLRDSAGGYLPPEKQAPINTEGLTFLVGSYLNYSIRTNIDLILGGHYRRTNGKFLNEDVDSLATKPFFIGEIADEANTIYKRSYWKSNGNDVILEAKSHVRLGNHVLTAGIEALINSIHFGASTNAQTGEPFSHSSSTDTTIFNLGGFLQDEYKPVDEVTILAGFRVDDHSSYRVAVSPKVGVTWKPLGFFRVKGSLARGFRSPALSELHMPDLTVKPGFVLRSNPNVTPEDIWAADVGIGVVYKNYVKAQADYFYNWMEDLITPDIPKSYIGDALSDGAITHKNTSKAWGEGIEIETESPFFTWFTPFFNYAYTVTRNESVARKQRYEDVYIGLDYIPVHRGTIGSRMHVELGKALLTGKYMFTNTGPRGVLNWEKLNTTFDPNDPSPQPPGIILDNALNIQDVLPPYTILSGFKKHDVSVGLLYNDRYKLGLTIQNISNEEYLEHVNSSAPRRLIWLDAGIRF
ncbi:MAG: TonB-dependent receptor [Chitinivibrionales bacterium]|nr:TonB-dependent receptor [Chitinivibrionales bacterium]